VPPREDCRDAFISQRYASLGEIPAGGRVGTGSLRRKVQILHRRPDLEVVHLRGNVDTRLRKLETEGLDAIILAAAGLKRLGLGHIPRGFLDETEMLPAIGQGALGLEVRADDQEMLELLSPMNHFPSQAAVTAERAFLARLEGGCLVPVAARGRLEEDSLSLEALISDLEGRRVFRDRLVGPPEEADTMGRRLAEMLLERGGGKILQEIFGRPF
jgi:hydroxymethylbilane synthase